MPLLGNSRRRTVALLAGGLVIVLAVMVALNAFNTTSVRFLNPETAAETLISTSITVLGFLLLLLLLVLLLRNIFKVYVGQGNSRLGNRLRTRMMLGAMLIALAPAVLMFLFCFNLMNRSMDRWFSPRTAELSDDSTQVVRALAQYVTNNARQEAQSIAAQGAVDGDQIALNELLNAHRGTLAGGFVMVYGKQMQLLASFQAPPESAEAKLLPRLDEGEQDAAIPLRGPLSSSVAITAGRSDEPMLEIGGQEYTVGGSVSSTGRVVAVALPMPQGLSQTAERIHASASEYWELFRARHQWRTIFILVLLVITALVFFSSVWVASILSNQITRPVEALANAMDEIAAGKYDHRVALLTTGEMAELVRAFNHMATDLDTSRQLAESSSAQLTAANMAIEERRRELETIVETIPSGVATLDGAGVVLQANRAFAALMGRQDDLSRRGEKIDALLPPECAGDVAALIRRGKRMGAASTEVDLHSAGRTVHLAVTSARLDLAGGQAGTVLVIEDTTELLRAQRQLAWKEVAQRVAHEIKNPLTPIALSADRIRRHLDRGQSDSNQVIRKCSEVILGCVATLRSLVDQFSALAEFPAPQPRACNLNQVAEEAMAMFAGRLDGITVRWDLDESLPPVMADPVAIRRALANLIDNAAEAMQGSLLRVLGLQSALCEDADAVEITVSDTGHGLTDEIRERLFLPFYSTKQRGTGLGLSIAAKIAQEHGGTLRAEVNTPKGARFLLRLPLMEKENGAVQAQPAEAVSSAASLEGIRS